MVWSLGLLLTVGTAATESEAARVLLNAERVLHDEAKGRTVAEGRAALVTADAAVDAQTIFYDRDAHTVTAVGAVVARLAQNGMMAVVADVVVLRFEGDQVEEVFFLDGRAEIKKEVSKELFLRASSAEAVHAIGTTSALLYGHRLERDGSGWKGSPLRVVPCDCDLHRPSWSIRASSGTLDPKAEEVSMWNPSAWVGPVPIFYFPWLSLPLSNRRSGLLIPKPSFLNPQLGFSYQQPIYVTLGRSADLTLTPGYFGGPPAARGSGAPAPLGMKGPRLGVEFQYVPARTTEGKISLGVLYDFADQRDVAIPSKARVGAARGLRWEGAWTHTQDFGAGFGARVDASAHSDGYLFRDVTTDVILRESGYLRSSASVFHRSAETYFGVDVGLRQDLRWGFPLFGVPVYLDPAAAPQRGPTPMQRLPAVQFGLPLLPLWGPLAFDLQASFVRIAPLVGLTGDEGGAANEGRLNDPLSGQELPLACLRARLYRPIPLIDASYANEGCDLSRAALVLLKEHQGDGVYQAGEREARDRLDALPRLRATGRVGRVLSLTGTAAWRQSVWRGEASGRLGQRGYPVFGARAETALARDFGAGSYKHRVTPWIELRAVPFVLGSTPAPYDEVDLSVPDTAGRSQALVGLAQRLNGPGGAEVLRLELNQGIDLLAPGLAAPRLNETFARLRLSVGWVTAAAAARVDLSQGLQRFRPTLLSAGLGLDDQQGHGAEVSVLEVADEGSARLRGFGDLLFGPPPWQASLTPSRLLNASLHWRAGYFEFRYQATGMTTPWVGEDLKPSTPIALVQHRLTLGFKPACDCWEIVGYLDSAPRTANYAANPQVRPSLLPAAPEFGVNVTISGFGSIGGGR